MEIMENMENKNLKAENIAVDEARKEENLKKMRTFFDTCLTYDPKTKTVTSKYDVNGILNAFFDETTVLLKDESAKSANVKEQLNAVKKRLTEQINEINAKVDFIENIIIDQMVASGKKRIYTESSEITLKTAKALQVNDEDALIQYAMDNNLNSLYKIKPTVNKTEIKKYIKETGDQEIQKFAEIVENKSITIK